MGREAALLVVAAVAGMAPGARAQATGMPSFNAPYRAFQRSELGAVFSFPDGGGTGFEGAYRYASGTLDVGLRRGHFDSVRDGGGRGLRGAYPYAGGTLDVGLRGDISTPQGEAKPVPLKTSTAQPDVE